jgi:hypothetical protein
MEFNNIIQYAIIFFMALFLIGCHNWLFKSAPSNPFKRSTIDLTPKEQVVIYVGLFVGTVLLMFWFAPTSQFILGGLIAFG